MNMFQICKKIKGLIKPANDYVEKNNARIHVSQISLDAKLQSFNKRKNSRATDLQEI